MEHTKYLANKAFVELCENATTQSRTDQTPFGEGVVTSLNEFLDLMVQANDIHSDTFKIPDHDRLILAEDVPSEIVHKLNNATSFTEVDANTLRDLRIVTYTADEVPAVIGARTPDSRTGTKSIKWRFIDSIDDPDYTGYQQARFGKDIDAYVDFHVWGINFEDIRKRGALLRDVVDNNVWFFKHKGLRDIVWLESVETRLWDGKNLVKQKIERYMLRYTMIKTVREKSLEQIAIQLGLEEPK